MNEDAVFEAVDAADGVGEALAELNSNRPADDLVAGSDEVVVDLDDGVGGHGEADALITG